MLVRVSIYWSTPKQVRDVLKPHMLVTYNTELYSVHVNEVVRCGDDICVDDSKLTEDSKVQTKDR